MITSETLRKLSALELSTEQMSGVLELLADVQQKEEDRLAQQRERKRKQRDMSRDSHGTVTGQVCDKKTKRKKEPKKEKIKNIILPPYIPPELWEEYRQHRKQKGASLTETAERNALAKLERMRASGTDPTAVIRQTLENGWTGLFEIKENQNGKSRSDIADEATERALARANNGGLPQVDSLSGAPELRHLQHLRERCESD